MPNHREPLMTTCHGAPRAVTVGETKKETKRFVKTFERK
jgi:hypothetical protein